MNSRWLRNSFIYLLILVAVIAIVVSFFRSGDNTKNISFSDVVAAGRAHDLKTIEVNGQSQAATLVDSTGATPATVSYTVKLDPAALRYIALSTNAKDMAENMYRALWSWIVCVVITVVLSMMTLPFGLTPPACQPGG